MVVRIFIPQSEADCVAGCVADCVARCVAWINFPEQSGKQSRLPSADFLVAFNKKRTDDRKGWINGADEESFVPADWRNGLPNVVFRNPLDSSLRESERAQLAAHSCAAGCAAL